MSIVARGGLVFEFYMEQSTVDFGYISKYSPQVSGLNLCSCYSKHNCARPSSDPLHLREYRGGGGKGMETTGKIRPIEVTENILFFVVESRDVPTQHTHIYILPTALILRKDSHRYLFLVIP